MIIFGGGLGSTSPCQNDTWVLDDASGVPGTPNWIQLNPVGGPPGVRDGSTAVYDSGSNRMTIFGGGNCFNLAYGDVWILSNANGLGGTPKWTQQSPAGSGPSGRVGSSAVYDSLSNRMIIFGGDDGTNASPTFLNDTWILANANGVSGTPAWTQLSPSGTLPPGR